MSPLDAILQAAHESRMKTYQDKRELPPCRSIGCKRTVGVANKSGLCKHHRILEWKKANRR